MGGVKPEKFTVHLTGWFDATLGGGGSGLSNGSDNLYTRFNFRDTLH